MEIKKIKIFIATSIDEFSADRNELARFVQGLNNRFVNRGIFIELEPYIFGELEEYIGRKEEFAEYIKEADFVFFLFFTKLEEYTRQEFEIALEAFKESDNPKIFTYFREVTDEIELSQELNELMDRISNKLQHYYNRYEHIDSVKLGFLLQIAELSEDRFEVCFEDNQVLVDNQELMYLDNIPEIANNPEMHRLKKLLAEATEKYDPDAIEEAEKQIHDLEAKTLKHMRDMYNTIAKGRVDTMLKKAYSCLEKGDLAGADKVLDKKRIDEIAELAQQSADRAKGEAERALALHREKINVQEMQECTEERIQIIRSCYENIYQIALRNFIGYEEVLNYADFLNEQNDKSAGDVYKRVEWLFLMPGADVEEENCQNYIMA